MTWNTNLHSKTITFKSSQPSKTFDNGDFLVMPDFQHNKEYYQSEYFIEYIDRQVREQ